MVEVMGVSVHALSMISSRDYGLGFYTDILLNGTQIGEAEDTEFYHYVDIKEATNKEVLEAIVSRYNEENETTYDLLGFVSMVAVRTYNSEKSDFVQRGLGNPRM